MRECCDIYTCIYIYIVYLYILYYILYIYIFKEIYMYIFFLDQAF